MSKKQLYNRLSKVFTQLEKSFPPLPDVEDESGHDVDQLSEIINTVDELNLLAQPTHRDVLAVEDVKKISTHESTGLVKKSNGGHNNIQGITLEKGSFHPALQPLTPIAEKSLQGKQAIFQAGRGNSPAALAVPILYNEKSRGVIEIVDDQSPTRNWSEDERLLAQEVANQLALAIENAQLYATVQQELSDRVRAEQQIFQRNQDLTVINQIGQELSKLTDPIEIIEFLTTSIGKLVDDNNLSIYLIDPNTQRVLSAISKIDGNRQVIAENAVLDGVSEYAIRSKSILVVNEKVAENLKRLGVTQPQKVPQSVMALPLQTGEHRLGVILLQDFTKEKAYSSIVVELISTISAQATTALENANLFSEIRTALQAIETRERYQAGVAQTIAILSKMGTRSMPDVLEILGQATRCDRVYYARIVEDLEGPQWQVTSKWMVENLSTVSNPTLIHPLPLALFPNWANALRDRGILFMTNEDVGTNAEVDFLKIQKIQSSLLLAVPSQSSVPNFIGFDQLGEQRQWANEEINILRVAMDGLKNTILREDLMDQLQGSLDETEHLYNASHRLALAGDLDEMVMAIALGMHTTVINRVALALFAPDEKDGKNRITISANWYSGNGTPPLPVGTTLERSIYENLFTIQNATFYDDITQQISDPRVLEDLTKQGIRSLAILPLWAGKRQLGVVMLQSDEHHPFTALEIRSYPPLIGQMATAVENNLLFEQTQKALGESENLYKISSGISHATNIQELCMLVAQNIMPVNSDRVSIIKMLGSETDHQEMEIVGFYDRSMVFHRYGLRLSSNEIPMLMNIRSDYLYIPDISNSDVDPKSKETLEKLNIRADCVIPMFAAGRKVGFLNISSQQPSIFTGEEIHTLQVAANSIAIAMERQRLLEEAQRRALELQAAAEIARDTTSTLSLDILLSRIVNLVVERFQYNHAAIFLVDENGTFATIREAFGEAGSQMKQAMHRHAVGSRSVIGTVTSTGSPVIVNDVASSPIHARNPFLPGTKAEMAIPLKLGDRVTGALDIQSKDLNAFNPDDVGVLQILADQIAVAIENARSYELSQKAIEDMKEVDRVKSQFLANMSHELRTPLNSIIGFSRVILKGIDGPINDIQTQDLTAIYNSGQHLLSLITDILDLSKIEAGKMELSFADVDLNDLINSVLSTATGLIKDKPIKLIHNLPQKVPIIQADPTRVRQVLINLISNAAKFTEQGSITVNLGQQKSPAGTSEAIIKVTDTGPGIAEKDQIKLFQPFSQVDDSPTRKTGGTGLGLSISRSFIEMHHGRIGLFSSEVGVGSTFFFTLPCSQESAEPEQEEQINNDPIVMSIDDDPQVINLYQRYLSSHGYQVVAVTDPKTAVDYAKQIKPFAITLDIMMPEKDGWSVIHDLKNDTDTRNIPVIICSILEEEEKGVNFGAADYLVKPFLPDDLTNAINRLNCDGQIHKVLVIDDDPSDLRLVEKMLSDTGKFQVTTAEGGIKGWDALLLDHPDIVIVDLFMPDLDGFTLIERMRSDTILNAMPVIILSGAELTAEQHQKLADFGKELMHKGQLRENELLDILETALRRYRNS